MTNPYTYRCAEHALIDCREDECLSIQERIALIEATDCIQELLGDDPDMPGHASTIEHAEKLLAKFRWLITHGRPEGECKSCHGYGHFNEKTDKPSLCGRKCLDCRGTGKK